MHAVFSDHKVSLRKTSDLLDVVLAYAGHIARLSSLVPVGRMGRQKLPIYKVGCELFLERIGQRLPNSALMVER